MATRTELLKAACEGIPSHALEHPFTGEAKGGFSFVCLRETLRDLVKQYRENDAEGVEESIALVEMNVSLLSGEG